MFLDLAGPLLIKITRLVVGILDLLDRLWIPSCVFFGLFGFGAILDRCSGSTPPFLSSIIGSFWQSIDQVDLRRLLEHHAGESRRVKATFIRLTIPPP